MAINYLEKALELAKTQNNNRLTGAILNSIGLNKSFIGNNTESIKLITDSILILKEIFEREKLRSDESGYGIAIGNLGIAYSAQSQYGKAIEAYSEALAIHRRLGEKVYEARILNNMGMTYSALQDLLKADDFFQRALILVKNTNDPKLETTILLGLGGLSLSAEKPDISIDYFNRSLKIARKLKNSTLEAISLSNLGLTYLVLKDYPQSKKMHIESKLIFTRINDLLGLGLVQSNLGIAELHMNELGLALQCFHDALLNFRKVGSKNGIGMALMGLKAVYSTKASTFYSPLLAIHFGKKSINSFQEVRKEIKSLEKSTQKSYIDSLNTVYRAVSDLLVEQGRLSEAQQILDLLKNQEYFDFIRRDLAFAKALEGRLDLTPREKAAYDEYTKIADELAGVAAELQKLEKKQQLNETTPEEDKRIEILKPKRAAATTVFEAFLRDLPKRFPKKTQVEVDHIAMVGNSRSLVSTLATLSEKTEQKPVAVYTLVGEDRLSLLVVTKESGLISRQVPVTAAKIHEAVFAFKQDLMNPRADPTKWGTVLYDYLIRPIEPDLNGADPTTLMWSLDDTLRYIPMAALWDSKKKQYLIEKYAGSLFAFNSLDKLREAHEGEWSGLAAGTSQKFGDFDALSGVEAELEPIGPGGSLPGKRLLNADFTKKNFLREVYGRPIVHIASHFDLKPGDWRQSALLLGDGTRWNMEEMNNDSSSSLFKDVDLLLLSACNTATAAGKQGEKTDGSEFEGFAALAQNLGAKAVVASLWPVSDIGTSSLMRRFYVLRQEAPERSKIQTLRQAQLDLLTGIVKEAPTGVIKGPLSGQTPTAVTTFSSDPNAPLAHPYYWASFVLVGNWR